MKFQFIFYKITLHLYILTWNSKIYVQHNTIKFHPTYQTILMRGSEFKKFIHGMFFSVLILFSYIYHKNKIFLLYKHFILN